MARRGDALPVGNVTFLLTDIEGSTQRWQAAPDEMTGLVSRHYEILDAGIDNHRGQRPEEQGEGDSIVAVFTDPLDAVSAALETQLALRRELPDLPVRMAVHTGEAMLRNENNYVGLTIITCARIRGCGHGGQILVSDDAANRVHETLPDPSAMIDLGTYGLKGLVGRERIWQLTHPELPTDLPPLNAGTSAAGNLSTPVSSFVGRRTELTAISHSLDADRLVTLTGETGIGKSRLGNAAAHAAANSMPGGVWWIELADVATDDLDAVAEEVLHACSLTSPNRNPVDSVIDHFRSVARSLIVVDGFQHAPVAASSLVDLMLSQCPDLRVLATGRDTLGIPGEVVHDVEPMELPPRDFAGALVDLDRFDATRLFLERATTADGRLRFDDGDGVNVARICRTLRGVPIGIELAAARSRSTPIADLAANLESSAADGTWSKHAGSLSTLSIAWTFQFLDQDAQIALRRLGVFRGSFEIDAATTVVAGDPLDDQAAATAIRRLLDEHLVVIDPDVGRMNMSPSVRAFAQERLSESADLAAAAVRHGSWFTAVAERFGEGGPEMPLSLLAPDEADVLDAMSTAMTGNDVSNVYRILIALATRWHSLGRPAQVANAASWICKRSPGDGEEQWAAAVARLCFALAEDPGAEVHAFADEANAIAELVGDDESTIYLSVRNATDAAATGDTQPAIALLAEARSSGTIDVTTAIETLLAVTRSTVEPGEGDTETDGSVLDDMAAGP